MSQGLGGEAVDWQAGRQAGRQWECSLDRCPLVTLAGAAAASLVACVVPDSRARAIRLPLSRGHVVGGKHAGETVCLRQKEY